MTIPCFEEGILRGIKMRSIDPQCDKRYRYWSLKGSRQGLFNIDAVRYKLNPILIVKGEIPAMLLDQLGFLACAPTSGESGWTENWRTALALSQKRIAVGDNDAPGIELGQKRAEFLHAELKFPAPAYKDWDEWYTAGPDEAVRITRSWITG